MAGSLELTDAHNPNVEVRLLVRRRHRLFLVIEI
jgi:hypothetical protein